MSSLPLLDPKLQNTGNTGESPRASEVRGRLEFLDVARGLAALIVVFQHSIPVRFPQGLTLNGLKLDIGLIGVTLFFLISGFIIPVSMERGGPMRFWVARIFRLWPLYLSSLAAILVVGSLGWTPLAPMAESNMPLFALTNTTMLQEFVGVPHAMPLYWTLSLELVFYILCTILFVLGFTNRSGYAWGAVAAITVMAVAAKLFSLPIPLGRVELLVSAFFGSFMYKIFVDATNIKSALPLLAAVIASQLVVAWARFDLLVVASWLAAYVIFLVLFRLRALEFPKVLVWIGTLSYSIYLVHGFVTRLLPHSIDGTTWVLLIFIITMAVSPITYYLIELPGISLGRKIAKLLSFRYPRAMAWNAPTLPLHRNK